MNLKKIYGFNEPFRFTGSSTGRWAVHIINNQYPGVEGQWNENVR
ncbi:hypothetical protein EC96154_A0161 [Escherichia coli 96.154]|nr:hypothetical protein EC96154_A0161 [Escherichia coli 96.154]